MSRKDSRKDHNKIVDKKLKFYFAENFSTFQIFYTTRHTFFFQITSRQRQNVVQLS